MSAGYDHSIISRRYSLAMPNSSIKLTQESIDGGEIVHLGVQYSPRLRDSTGALGIYALQRRGLPLSEETNSVFVNSVIIYLSDTDRN